MGDSLKVSPDKSVLCTASEQFSNYFQFFSDSCRVPSPDSSERLAMGDYGRVGEEGNPLILANAWRWGIMVGYWVEGDS